MSPLYGSFYAAIVAKLAAEEDARRAWLEEVAARNGIIRMPESLTPAELEAQQDRVDRAMGRKFYPTTALPGLMLDRDGFWYRTEPL